MGQDRHSRPYRRGRFCARSIDGLERVELGTWLVPCSVPETVGGGA